MREWLVPVIAAALGGSLAQGIAVLLRVGADRQSVVAGGAEKAVLSLERANDRLEREVAKKDQRITELERELTLERLRRRHAPDEEGGAT